jgi:hypothetical protein
MAKTGKTMITMVDEITLPRGSLSSNTSKSSRSLIRCGVLNDAVRQCCKKFHAWRITALRLGGQPANHSSPSRTCGRESREPPTIAGFFKVFFMLVRG